MKEAQERYAADRRNPMNKQERTVKDPDMAVLPPDAEGPLMVKTTYERTAQQPMGCICPAGAEATCRGLMCPRRAINGAGGLSSLRQ